MGKFQTTTSCIALFLLAGGLTARAETVEVDSLEELAAYAGRSGNSVRMAPGEYKLRDWIPLDQIAERREAGDWHFIEFDGSDNDFNLTGVTIEVDTELREALRAPIHNPEFVITGDGNTLRGLTIRNIGDGTSNGGNVLSVHGDDNTLRDVTLHVRGSSPYGYGDLFGKGGGPVIGHRKHSGLQIAGDHTRLIGCRVYMRSFGHGFYMQNATDTYLEDCYVEGEMRSTDEMLAETSGPAHAADFRSVYRNREGGRRVLPGYMKSLAEDGFRAYGNAEDVTLINCTSKNMRAGFELRSNAPVRIEGGKAIGNERGFWVGSEAVIRGSRGDAKYGPLLFVEGNNARINLELLPAESEMKVHALATIHGSGHQITLTAAEGEARRRPVPIRLGYSQPGAGEGMSPYSERPARDISLENHTRMPLVIGEKARDCAILTCGNVRENAGQDVAIELSGEAE